MSFVPAGYNTLSPYLLVRSATEAAAFVAAITEATEIRRLVGADGTVKHLELRVGDSILMIGERGDKAQPASTHVYVHDVDAAFARALAAGASVIAEPRDLPYGDRSAGVRDPQGNLWWLGSHVSSD